MSAYQPQPIDTDAVETPEHLLELIETLSENAHDVWAAKRMAEGWRYGPARDDAKREHPSLLPYAALPEAEKDVDRAMVLGVVKAILSKGFQISKP